MSDDDLKRLLGMNAPLGTLSAPEIDALRHRIGALCPDHRSRIEAILRREAEAHPDLARTLCQGLAQRGRNTEPPPEAVRFKAVRRLTLVFITLHSFAVTLAMLRLLHR